MPGINAPTVFSFLAFAQLQFWEGQSAEMILSIKIFKKENGGCT